MPVDTPQAAWIKRLDVTRVRGPVPDHREAAVHRMGHELAAARAATGLPGDPLAPRVLEGAQDGSFIAFERLTGASPLHELFASRPQTRVELARAAGATLARLHRAPLPRGLPAAPIPFPSLAPPRVEQLAEIPGGWPVFVSSVIADQRCRDALRWLREAGAAAPAAFVHGDVKLDNLMAPDGAPAVWLVDWEHGGSGDPAWDIGALAGDYLFLAIGQMAAGSQRHQPWTVPAGAVTLREAAQCAGAALAAYADAGGPARDEALAGYAGIYLLQRAQAFIERRGRFSARPLLYVHVARRLLTAPRAELEPLLGAPRERRC